MRCSNTYYYKKHLNPMNKLFDIDKIKSLRKELHQNPELSDNEYKTAERIANFLHDLKPDQLIRGIGGNGIACIFKGKKDGPSVLFRCDMDALPIEETNDFEYKSVNKGVAHKCGHDGHMAIISGLAEAFSKNRPESGQVVLVYQPSEENGQGADRMLNDSKWEKIDIDYAFALHNLPGFKKKTIVARNENFASASKGMIIKLRGKTSHAAEPENGITPAIAMAEIIKELSSLPQKGETFSDFTLVTIIYARLGEIAFGTTPGYAEIMATLRTYTNRDMEVLTEQAEVTTKHFAAENFLSCEISYTEEFPATVNDQNLNELVKESAKELKLDLTDLENPFKWSEDFGHFTNKYPGVLFGIGSGEDHPQLHNPDYDFPDDIIEDSVKLFYQIFKNIAKNQNNQ